MKRNLLIGTIALLAGSLLAADSSPKDDVVAAAKKLADKGNYSWKTTMDLGPDSQFTPGPTEGKVEKGGLTWPALNSGVSQPPLPAVPHRFSFGMSLVRRSRIPPDFRFRSTFRRGSSPCCLLIHICCPMDSRLKTK